MAKGEEKVRVEFLTNCSPYNAGDVAGFLPRDAAKLHQRGVVKFLDDDAESAQRRENKRLSSLALGDRPGELASMPLNNTAVVNALGAEGEGDGESSGDNGTDGTGEGKDSSGSAKSKKGSSKKSGKKKSGGKKKRVKADS